MKPAVLNRLTKKYNNGRGIENVSLEIERGQVYGLLGPNGSGKTTTMKLMAGLMRPDSGQIFLFGEDPQTNIEKALAKIGCLIETPAFYPYLSARKNLEIVSKLSPGQNLSSIDLVLDQVGLRSYQKEKVNKYSLGMKQRLGLAMALLPAPELLILDEPANGLDIEGIVHIRNIIVEQSRLGCTVLIASHIASEIEQVCTHVAIIREGNLFGGAKVSQLLAEHGNVENYYLTLVKEQIHE
jgi:ABC-2 type transport system ATP-binding protein